MRPQVERERSAAAAMLVMLGFVVLAVSENEGEMEQAVETTADLVGCPSCGAVAELHDRRPSWVRDVPTGGRPVTVVWVKRVWRCAHGWCPKRTWTPDNSGDGRTTLAWRFEPDRHTVLTHPRIDCVYARRRHGSLRPCWPGVRQSGILGCAGEPAVSLSYGGGRLRAWHTDATTTTFCRSGFRKRLVRQPQCVISIGVS